MKKTVLAALCLFLIFSVSYAEDKGNEAEISLWDIIRSKIERVTPKKKLVVTTAVGGVRGARSESGADLYWKGEKVQPDMTEEMTQFENALFTAENGEIMQALVQFETFELQYPESVLKDDASQAIMELKKLLAKSAVPDN